MFGKRFSGLERWKALRHKRAHKWQKLHHSDKETGKQAIYATTVDED
jgi:hypothetical protein